MGILKKIKKSDDKKTEEKTQDTPAEVKAEKNTEKKQAAKKETAPTKSAKTKSTFHLAEVILHPVVTEKSATLASSGKYIFAIDRKANKIQVKSAIKAMYGITPVSVNIQNMKGKKVRFGRRFGKRKDWKKAIVTLPAGKTIDVYEGV